MRQWPVGNGHVWGLAVVAVFVAGILSFVTPASAAALGPTANAVEHPPLVPDPEPKSPPPARRSARTNTAAPTKASKAATSVRASGHGNREGGPPGRRHVGTRSVTEHGRDRLRARR